MHLAKSSLDGHVHGRKVGVRGHHTDDAASGRIKAWGNNTQNNILAGEDTRNSALILHQDGCGVVLLHQLGSLLDRCPHADGGGWDAVEDRLEGRTRHLGPQGLNILNNLLRLTCAQLGLHTLEGVVETARRRVGPLQLLHGLVKALCDIEHTRDVLVLVHNWQVAEALADHEVEGIGGTGIGSGAEGVLGHDFGNGDIGGLQPSSNNAEGEILGGEDAGNSLIVVGNKHAVFPFRGHQLGSLGNGRRGLDLEGGARLEGKDGAGRGFAGMAGSAGKVLLLGEITLQLAADGLVVTE